MNKDLQARTDANSSTTDAKLPSANLAQNPMLVAVVDKQIGQFSKMQVELLGTEINSDDYNKISEMIGTLKEYMINCRSYNGN